MADLEHLIRYENEHSALDFKSEQYRKGSHEALLKDVLAMANADVEGDRHVVIGVKHLPDGSREIIGIERSAFVDPATYQELVRANIEPSIDVDYLSVDLDGKVLAVLRISGCEDPPYLMKKDFGALKIGDGFIRKGSHQARLTRSDFDRMIASKTPLGPSESDLVISLDPTKHIDRLTIDPLIDVALPSARAAATIRAILAEREEHRKNPGLRKFGPAVLANITMPSIFGGQPYHLRSDNELREDLENIAEAYIEDDLYELYEEHAFKLNIYITNQGTAYVEDAEIELTLPELDGLLVADQIHRKPARGSFPSIDSLDGLAMPYTYPTVQSVGNSILISDQIGEIKHQRTTEAFADPVRVAFGPDTAGEALQITCRIHARNLSEPVTRVLTLAVSSASDSS